MHTQHTEKPTHVCTTQIQNKPIAKHICVYIYNLVCVCVCVFVCGCAYYVCSYTYFQLKGGEVILYNIAVKANTEEPRAEPHQSFH